jgi:hypothetical protein
METLSYASIACPLVLADLPCGIFKQQQMG